MKIVSAILFIMLIGYSTVAMSDPALVTRGDNNVYICLDGNGDPATFDQSWQRVETNSDTGEIMWMVHGDCLGALPEGGAAHWSDQNTGYICTFEAPYFQMTVTPNGKTSLKCQNWPFDDDD